jgi:hypothetical protein
MCTREPKYKGYYNAVNIATKTVYHPYHFASVQSYHCFCRVNESLQWRLEDAGVTRGRT